MNTLIKVAITMGLLSFFNLNAAQESLAYVNITAVSAHAVLKDATRELIVLDVRTLPEYKDGHIKGTILIPVQELEERIAELDQYKNIEKIVYCRSGNRSVTASKILTKHGHVTVFNMLGGVKAWTKIGLPLEKKTVSAF